MTLAVGLLAISMQNRAFPLMVGDTAPKLNVSSWVKGEPVSSFKKGQVYVIETWATWCEPCRHWYPHLSELQKKYSDKVAVIGVAVWEEQAAAVKPFVDKMGDVMSYRIALDIVPSGKTCYEGKTSTEWINASGMYSQGIPLTFVVDQNGKLAWIGHPSELDGPLEQIVSGKWDLPTEAKRYAKHREPDVKSEPLIMNYYRALIANDRKGQISACDQLLLLDASRFGNYGGKKFTIMYRDLSDSSGAIQFAQEAWTKFGASASVLSSLANEMLLTRSRELVTDALKYSEQSVKIDGGKDAYSLQTLARARFRSGNKEGAIEAQTKAITIAPAEDRANFEKLLELFKGATALPK